MPDQRSPPNPRDDGGYFSSEGCDIIEIREEDTQPGGKTPPPDDQPPDKPN